DERTAGFLALGLSRAGTRPAAVVTTSGTAAANLHPAVLEAYHSGAPLVASTADRPPRLTNSGANQTTDQHRLFGVHLRGFAALDASGDRAGWRFEMRRLLSLASGARTRSPGPVQLNVAFDSPLVPAGPPPDF